MQNSSLEPLTQEINPLDYQKSASPLIAQLRVKTINMLALNGPVTLSPEWELVCDDRNKSQALENHALYFINEADKMIMRMKASKVNPEYDHPSYPKSDIPKNYNMHFSFSFQRFGEYGQDSSPEELRALSASEWKTFKNFAYSMNECQKFEIPFKAIEKDLSKISHKELKRFTLKALDSTEDFKELQEFALTQKLSSKEQAAITNHFGPGLGSAFGFMSNIDDKRGFHTAQELKIILKALEIEHTDSQFVLTCNSGLMPYLRIERFGIEASRREEWSEFGLAIDYLFDHGAAHTQENELSFNDLDNGFYLFEHDGLPAMSLTSQSCGYIFIKDGDVIEGYATGNEMLYSKEEILQDTGVDKLSLIIQKGEILYWDSLLDPEQYTIFGGVSALADANLNGEETEWQYGDYKSILNEYKKTRDIIKEKKLLQEEIAQPSNSILPGETLKI